MANQKCALALSLFVIAESLPETNRFESGCSAKAKLLF